MPSNTRTHRSGALYEGPVFKSNQHNLYKKLALLFSVIVAGLFVLVIQASLGEVMTLKEAIKGRLASEQGVKSFRSFLPQGLQENVMPTVPQIQEYVGNILQYYDQQPAGWINLEDATSSVMTQYIVSLGTVAGLPEDAFSDIDESFSVLSAYAQAMNTPEALFNLVKINTVLVSGGKASGSVFGPPLISGLPIQLNPQFTQYPGYQMMRVLYTAFSLIGHFYQHHHIPMWIPPPQNPADLPTYTYYKNYSVINPDQANIDVRQGTDCTSFLAFVHYVGLGVYFSADTQQQAAGQFTGSNNEWMATSPLVTNVLATTSLSTNTTLTCLLESDCQQAIPLNGPNGNPTVYMGAVVVDSAQLPIQNFEDGQIGDMVYLGTENSTFELLVNVTHGVINLGYPYIIDSDNFFMGEPSGGAGIFIRNVEKIINSGNRILGLNNIFTNVFLTRRVVGMTGEAKPTLNNDEDELLAAEIVTATNTVTVT